MKLLYFLIVFIANMAGALSGMGGGVLIKPLIEAVGYHSVREIAFYSSTAVFFMAISSSWRQYKNGMRPAPKICAFISAGAICGGAIGNKLLEYSLCRFNSDSYTARIQIVLTVITLIMVIIYTSHDIESLDKSGFAACLSGGLFLGTLSTFLGIGGGPVNVAFLMFCYGFSIKDAAVYSIITIFFSQGTKLGMVVLGSSLKGYDLSFLPVIIGAALAGGYTGGSISRKLTDQATARLFQVIVGLVMLINVYNFIAK